MNDSLQPVQPRWSKGRIEETAFRLPVGDGHELAGLVVGRADAVPAVFLHGGPGAGFKRAQADTFDPSVYRVILFDQRGAGESTPHAETRANTTGHLVADIERVREYLGIERWLVAGGSWGSCLALAYGAAHPERCLGFRLHGIFLATPPEIDWWFHGSSVIFPDFWEEFAGFVPEQERGDLLSAYHRRLHGEDEAERLRAALALRTYSARTQTLVPDDAHIAALSEPMAALSVARLFTHYCANGAFMEAGALLSGIERFRHLPAEIVQGRYDTVTPMATAWRLHRAWPEASFTIASLANHVVSPGAPALKVALSQASERLSKRLFAARPA